MAPQLMKTNSGDSLLQLALSITPSTENPFDVHDSLDNDGPNFNAEPTDRNPNLFAHKVPAIAFDPQGVDDMIASQMAKLSVDDREKAYMDVHGVPSDYVTETPELIHLNLLDMQNEIELLPDKHAYNLAERLGPEFVHDRDFRLAFLRCEKFDCPKAALRFVRHFQMKLDLFGAEKLVMHITQDDLGPEAMDVLYAVGGRFLNARDRAGRLINFVVTTDRVVKTDPALRKSFYNINITGIRNEELQHRGITVVVRRNDGRLGLSGENLELNWKLGKVNQASPVRLAAIHYCFGKESWSQQQALSKTAMSQPQQVRLRMHHGSVKKCLEELRSHGIDPDSIPLNDKGEMTDVEEARRLLNEQRRYERLNFPLRSTFHVPFCEDVLLGKGTPIQNHPGNKKLRQMVSDHIKHYDKSQRAGKKAIALGIIDTIRQRGGLFLKQDGSKWIRVNDDVARLKVTAAFRTYRQSQKLFDD